MNNTSNKFRYPIFPDRTYTFEYEDFTAEVLGQDILNMFHRGLYLDYLLADLSKETKLSTDNHISDDLDTPDF
jgi:hypothetical protein